MTTSIERSTQPKIDQLRALILQELVPAGELTIIARSNDSPVMRAISSAREAVANADCTMRVVFLQAGSQLDDGMSDSVTVDLRYALNPRLLEAHEQLVVGKAVWIGDCMRRDPGKRDAFAQEKIGCAVTSTFAALSFEKLWAIGTPIVPAAAVAELSAATPNGRDVTR